ncbi:AbgT family transporter [uncultured Tyzzerella sp.]|uniref:AbgT family transporter n=1 Tax=uncultured Tyzzerella sp. TaxID=2321398 RepID=UPI002943B77D|nr:AbgT family transporter [uncultured Tyzzerella sp.]
MDKVKSKQNKVSFFNKFLNGVEIAGNKLPHPVTLFAILALIIVVLSAICEAFGVSATGEIMNTKTMEIEEKTITAVSLLSGEGISYMITNAISNFTGFAPLGVVLVTMLGVGCAEGSGYIAASMKKLISKTPARLITPVVVFLGVISNVASDVGYVVLVPIGAIVFMAYKRHPLAGLAAAFAGVSGGFSANLLIGTVDALLASISTEAAAILNPTYEVGATANWFFMFVSTFLIVIIGTFVTDKIVEPRLGSFETTDESIDKATELTPKESKALTVANISLLVYILLIIIWAIPKNSLLRNPENGSLISKSLLINGIIVFITIGFFIPSVIYGRMSGTYKNEKDIGNQLSKNMESMGSYIALTFVAAQFINYFSYTNLGSILALKGADFLGNIGFTGAPLMIVFILLTAFINLFMGSASAKWTILAPIFIPMFMQLGYSPELTQVAYRIGDSTTNIISPLMVYFAMIVVFAKKYDKKSGIGTLISIMLPYSIMFLIGWTILLVIWMLLGLPLGPGVSMFYQH